LNPEAYRLNANARPTKPCRSVYYIFVPSG